MNTKQNIDLPKNVISLFFVLACLIITIKTISLAGFHWSTYRFMIGPLSLAIGFAALAVYFFLPEKEGLIIARRFIVFIIFASLIGLIYAGYKAEII